MDKLEFLDGTEVPNEPVQPEAAAPEPVVETPPAPVEPAPPVAANPLEPPVLDVKPDPGFVPITALLEERDKRKAYEAELAQLRQSQQPQTFDVPDVVTDPDGYQAYNQSLIQSQTLNVKLDLSEDMARGQFGDDLVDKARDWALSQFQHRPGYQQEVFRQRNPYGYIVQQYQRDQIATQVSPEQYAQFQAWQAAQAALSTQQAAAPAAPIQSPSAPPPSIASLPSAGGVQHVPTGPGVAFDGLFQG